MERLTKRNPDGRADFAAKNRHKCDVCAVLNRADNRAFLDVLEKCAAYEDTGMTPEQITRLTVKRHPRYINRNLCGAFVTVCPSCERELADEGEQENFCPSCGQALDWNVVEGLDD